MQTEPQLEVSSARRLALSPERRRLFVQTVLALAAVVLGIKLGKLLFTYLQFPERPPLFQLLYTSWLVRILLATVIAFWVGTIIAPRRRWQIAIVPFVGLLVAKIAWALWRGNAEITYVWLREAAEHLIPITLAVFGAIRMDAAFLAGFAILVYAAVAFTPARFDRLLRVALAACTTLLLLISGLELAQFIKTGTTGTGHLLSYFVTNAAGLWPMLRAEVDLFVMAALVMPLLVGWAVTVLVRRWYTSTSHESLRNPSLSLSGALALSLSAAFIPPALVDHRFDRFNDNTYLGLRDLMPWRNAGQLEAARQANRLPAIFETSEAVVRPATEAASGKRNVVIIMLESVRADATSIYGGKRDTTPFLSRFAKRGAVVQDMYAVIPRTSAAWVAVLDGVWPSTDEEMTSWTQRERSRFKSLPALLATQGYASAFYTTAHTSFSYDAPLLKGMKFDSVHDGDSLPNQGFEAPSFWGFEDRMMLEPSLNWVKTQRDEQRPFLLAMMTTVGHANYEYPSTWRTQSFGGANAVYEKYLNCLGYIDSVMEDFIVGLDKLGVLRSSIVIIIGDHGESFGEHGSRTHALELYEETLKIPGIIYADGVVQPGTSIAGLRQEVDILPTVLDALGLAVENAVFSGSSMLRPVPVDRSIYFSGALYSQATAMRKNELKFIYNFGRIPTEAYRIDQDLGEKHNIASTLPRSMIEEVEMDMLVWRERVSRKYTSPTSAAMP